MRKTYDELLTMAEETLLSWDHRDGECGTSKAMFAQACVMLATERRIVYGDGINRPAPPKHIGSEYVNGKRVE